MKQTWRWFGPQDQVSIDDMLQAGVQGVVTALHHVPTGEIWSKNEIAQRINELAMISDGAASGLDWSVVESLPVSEDIKKQKGDWRQHIANYKTSLENLASNNIEIVCYNFMPVLDWTRTNLAWPRPSGARCMRFDVIDFAAFDIHILHRDGATESFPEFVIDQAERRFAKMTANDKTQLTKNIVSGLPGAAEKMSLDDVRQHLAEYDHISKAKLRAHYIDFLEEIMPTVQKLGMRICCHPDDPPFDLLGLPRIMSTEKDYQTMLNAVNVVENGVTLCTGSFGAHPENDLPAMVQAFADRIHFLHLRNVTREGTSVPLSFFEDEHLNGGTDMVAVIAAVLREEDRRRKQGRADHSIPMRPDHGQDILDDLKRGAQPGYPSIGRLKGLAELRGIEKALSHPSQQAGV